MMKTPRIKTLLLVPVVLFALFYLVGVIIVASTDSRVEQAGEQAENHEVIALFGASGTAGDGILKAALADPGVRKIHVITRRSTPRIEAGIAAGKVHMTQHADYLDYTGIHGQLAEVDTVYWAIGISSLGADQDTYGRIHVDFPLLFVQSWTLVNPQPDLSFHFISSSDISENSNTMWVREKIRAEKSLFGFAEGSNLRVIAYRPDYIGPTREEASLLEDMLYWFFRPVGAAQRATEIGRAMLEVTARGASIKHGTKINTADIIGFSDAYSMRHSVPD